MSVQTFSYLCTNSDTSHTIYLPACNYSGIISIDTLGASGSLCVGSYTVNSMVGATAIGTTYNITVTSQPTDPPTGTINLANNGVNWGLCLTYKMPSTWGQVYIRAVYISTVPTNGGSGFTAQCPY